MVIEATEAIHVEGEPGAGREAFKHMRDLPPQHTHTHARTHTHGHGIVRGPFIESKAS